MFDEADRLFEMGFADQIKETEGHAGGTANLPFSATLPQILLTSRALGYTSCVSRHSANGNMCSHGVVTERNAVV